ncbi:hypothetical protein Hdeb2414_s0004g00123531 [Helianthus debilis subsp. tardiflorus]
MFDFQTKVGKMKDAIPKSFNQTTKESINTGSLKPLVLKLRLIVKIRCSCGY